MKCFNIERKQFALIRQQHQQQKGICPHNQVLKFINSAKSKISRKPMSTEDILTKINSYQCEKMFTKITQDTCCVYIHIIYKNLICFDK